MNKAPVKFGKHVGMGKAVTRKEDHNFITGKGQYTDDVKLKGALRAFAVRSPYAHAKYKIVDKKDAENNAGVRLVLTADDIKDYNMIQCTSLEKQKDGTMPVSKDIPMIAKDVVRCVGDVVAFVVADTIEQAKDAAEMIEVDYDMLDAVVDTETAIEDGAPLVYDDIKNNIAFHSEYGNVEETKKTFGDADKITELKLINNRLVANYIEPRCCVANWDDEKKMYDMIVPTQGVHGMRDALTRCLKIKPEEIRVRTFDVGGGFGTKIFPYREYPLSLIAAKILKKPVHWLCERSEHFVADAHGRDNVTVMRMAMNQDGKFLALEVDLIAAMGAYLSMAAPFIPTLGMTIATGIYNIPNCKYTIRGVYTHTTSTDAYRGAGRPEQIYALERLVDKCAIDMNMSPDEIRRINAIKPEQLPHTTPFDRTYDTGEFVGHMEECIKLSEWNSFDQRAEQAKKTGKIRGIGMSTFIEACAFPGSEPAKVQLNDDGKVTLFIGTQSNGQGHQTAYSQFIAETLDMDIDDVEVRQGDTDELKTGGGTGGSRSVPLGGVSVQKGSEALAEKMKKIAAEKMETAEGDLELSEGKIKVAGTDKEMSFAEIAKNANETLTATGEFQQDEATYPNGTHICEVEIDPETGTTDVVKYTIVDDYGVAVNPLLLAGQVHGGVAQAIGQAIMERTHYDEDGQLITASLMDYQMPRAADLPEFGFNMRNVPSTTNALGMKGAGEAGTIGGTPAVMNAVVNALNREYGISHIDMPAIPLTIWETIKNAKK